MAQQGRRIVGRTEFPPYYVSFAGDDHLLVAGGGGAAKTGVQNQIATYLLRLSSLNPGHLNDNQSINLTSVCALDTSPGATMNADLVAIAAGGDNGKAGAGGANELRVVMAAGQDDQCAVYSWTLGHTKPIAANTDTKTSKEYQAGSDNLHHRDTSLLSLEGHLQCKMRTDFHAKSAYQKCVSLSHGLTSGQMRLATGGADGCLRLWKCANGATIKCDMVTQVDSAHKGDIDSCSLSACGEFLLSIGNHDHRLAIWHVGKTEGGSEKLEPKHVTDLQLPEELCAVEKVKYRPRFVNCTALGVRNLVFLVSYIPIQRGGKSQCSYLALCAFDHRRTVARPICVKVAVDEVISCQCVSTSGAHAAVGTLQGSVCVYDTHTLSPLYKARQTHAIFVTGVALAPECTQAPNSKPPSGALLALNAAHRAVCVSVSADQTVQLHAVGWDDAAGSYTKGLFLLFAMLLASYWWLKLIGV